MPEKTSSKPTESEVKNKVYSKELIITAAGSVLTLAGFVNLAIAVAPTAEEAAEIRNNTDIAVKSCLDDIVIKYIDDHPESKGKTFPNDLPNKYHSKYRKCIRDRSWTLNNKDPNK